MKRIFTGLLAVAMTACLLLSSCAKKLDPALSALANLPPEELITSEYIIDETSSSAATVNGHLVVPYDNTDSLNPYLSKTSINHALGMLMYDGLVKLDNDFTPVMDIASDITLEGNICTVTIKSDVQFSDGSELTASDVVYSMDCIKQSGGSYTGRLVNVGSYTASDDYTLRIELISQDNLYVNLLDFPIIKRGTYKEANPIGCGRYVMDTHDEDICLSANPTWHGGSIRNFKNVHLRPTTYSSDNVHLLKDGTLNALFSDFASGDNSANVGRNPILIPMMNFVFLGFNNGGAATSAASFRKAVSLALNRDSIAVDAYFLHATPTSTPFNPHMYATLGLENTAVPDLDASNSLLDGLGYTNIDDEGFRLRGGSRLTLRLLVNAEDISRTNTAEIIKANLAEVGITVKIITQNFQNYKEALDASDYDMYIGEAKLGANNDLTGFFSGGSLSYGIGENTALSSSYSALRSGSASYESFCADFAASQPFAPILFRTGVMSFTSTMTGGAKASYSDPFFNIERWSFVQ